MNHQVDPHMQFGHRGLSMEIKIATTKTKKQKPKNKKKNPTTIANLFFTF